MNKEVESSQATLAGIQEFVARYPFPIDQFQLDAIAQLAEGRSVLVAAPTGTGKTLVAEYAIWLAQQRNQRVIYTTPLKALSNQKHRDLREAYGFDAVGLVTGDIVEHSRAPIVVMTTEVYRNMLLEDGGDNMPASLADVGFVVFDELGVRHIETLEIRCVLIIRLVIIGKILHRNIALKRQAHTFCRAVFDDFAVTIFDNHARLDIRHGEGFRLNFSTARFGDFALENIFLLKFDD